MDTALCMLISMSNLLETCLYVSSRMNIMKHSFPGKKVKGMLHMKMNIKSNLKPTEIASLSLLTFSKILGCKFVP